MYNLDNVTELSTSKTASPLTALAAVACFDSISSHILQFTDLVTKIKLVLYALIFHVDFSNSARSCKANKQ